MQELEELKKEYIKTPIPSYLTHDAWFDLQAKLTPNQGFNFSPRFAYGLIFVTFIFLTTGVYTIAQAAKPASFFYPVKLLSDDILAKITGKQEIKIEKRAQEVIDLSRGPNQQLEEANKQYQKTLEETKTEAAKSGREQELRKTLEEQEQKLRQAQQQNPSWQLEEAIKKTEEVKGQVQGQKDQKLQNNPPGQNNQNNNSQNQNQNRGQEQKSNRGLDK